jgi:hypothetical protein
MELVIVIVIDSVYTMVMSEGRGDILYMKKWIYMYNG